LLCSKVSFFFGLCTKCNYNYYEIENDISNIGEYINCYNNPEGYYLDNNLYKKCYYTCKRCNITGNNINHNCIECNDNYTFIINKNNYINCYENCTYYYYFDNEYNYYHCTINSSCIYEYPILKENSSECIKNDIKNIIADYINERNNTEKHDIEYYDNILDLIENTFTDNYDTSKLDNGEDEIIKTDKMVVTLTTVENQKNNINENITTIDLGECENLLRECYNISNNITLYMKKIEVVQEGMKISKIEYDVYCKLFGINLIKLNVTACKNSKILILIPIELNENIDILNSSSNYYNDICYTTTSEDGTDITLKDRKNDFIDKNKTICQDDCIFSNYNNANMKAECSCKVKEFSSSSIADMKINKTKILENFIDIKNIVNLSFLICYNKLFTKKGILYNIGSYVILVIIFFHIITIFMLYIKQFPLLKNEIKDISFSKVNYKIFFNSILKNNASNIILNEKEIETENNKTDEMKTSQLKLKKTKKKKKKLRKTERIPPKIKDEKIMMLTNEEINNLNYNEAISYDKRTFFEYYISLLKTEHILIHIFYNHDYNSKSIKIDLLLIAFAIEYTVNALFYDDDTMHKIYQNKGEFDFIYQLPITIYSYLISTILNIPLNSLGLSNDAIILFKQEKSKIDIMNKAKDLEKKLKIRFVLYFIICFLFLFIFLYYISMFCVLYRNTQLHLLKDTLMSFGLSLIFPFFYNLLPGLFRIYSLSDNKNKRKCLYNFSKLLTSIF